MPNAKKPNPKILQGIFQQKKHESDHKRDKYMQHYKHRNAYVYRL